MTETNEMTEMNEPGERMRGALAIASAVLRVCGCDGAEISAALGWSEEKLTAWADGPLPRVDAGPDAGPDSGADGERERRLRDDLAAWPGDASREPVQ
jgi:hypothetical protein